MSDASSFDFSKFVPGFDFLKKLSGTGASASLPSASSWIAPTLDPEELDKRIQELKTVHFWLDQNTKAVSATIQALEVQKMTLATLRGMNMSMTELAESLKIKPDTLSSVFTRPEDSTPSAAASASAAPSPSTDKAASRPSVKAKRPAAPKPRSGSAAPAASSTASDTGSATAGVDPMAWWGSLTQQFQHIANQAMNDLQRPEPHPSASAAPKKTAAKKGAQASAPRSTKSKPARKSGTSSPRSSDT